MTLIEQLETRCKALNANEVAKLFGISKQHVYEMAADGSLPAFRVGRSIRFDPQELADCLRKKKPQGLRSHTRLDNREDARSRTFSRKRESDSLHRIWRRKLDHLEAAAGVSTK
jgi:excisionase family DNA binding protein